MGKHAVKFITLTCPPYYRSTDIAWAALPDAWNRLRTEITRGGAGCEYIRIAEATKRGYPHYHIIARCGYLDQRALSAAAERAGFGRVCWITAARSVKHCARYMVKYIVKDVDKTPIPPGQRLITRSRWWVPPVSRETPDAAWTWTLTPWTASAYNDYGTGVWGYPATPVNRGTEQGEVE